MPVPTLKNAMMRVLLRVGLFDKPTTSLSFSPEHAEAYDLGIYGRYPEIPFNSTSLIAPKVLKRTWSPACEADDDQYYFISPYGFADFHPGPMILDAQGHMVWSDQDYPQSYGLTVQQYHGKPYLTWWTGDDSVRGHGVGSYHMVDSSYRHYKKVGPLNNLPADLHEFKITHDNTALITSYVTEKHDLRPVGAHQEGYVWDGVFQEFNIETNELKFQWRATDHFNATDCMNWHDWEGTKENPWDYFHINSVDKDKSGNYLVSARYCGVSYISGRTGEPIWKLGGYDNSFEDLSNGSATNFAFQHHARWTDNYNSITLFDNQANSNYLRGIPSRGLKIALDQERMTAKVLNELIHPTQRVGFSQGSMQSLPNGNFLLGYGHSAAITEFHPNGEVACDLQFAPLLIGDDGDFAGGAGQSYRAFKQNWVGKPHYDPSVHFDRETAVYISWNGATEVKRWRLEGSVDRKSWSRIAQVHKSGFETKIEVQAQLWNIFRLTALNSKDEPIGKWNVFVSGTTQAIDYDAGLISKISRGPGALLIVFTFFALFAILSIAASGITVFCLRRQRKRAHLLLREKQFARAKSLDDDSEATSLTTSFEHSRQEEDSEYEDEKMEITKGDFV